MIRILHVIVLLLSLSLPGQQKEINKSLMERAEENFAHLKKAPDTVFEEALQIEKEAIETGNKEAELHALMTQCDYYRLYNDIENILKSATELFEKAKSYRSSIYQAIAKYDLFEAYFFTDLTEKAFQQVKEGVEIIENVDENTSLSIKTKTNLYYAYVNYFSLKNDYDNQFRYLVLAGDEFEKMDESDLKQEYLATHYSNFASYYLDLEQLDSVHYYAELSLEKDRRFNRGSLQFFNNLLLGEAEMKQGHFEEALLYFHEAENIHGYKNHINVQELYENIIESYSNLNQTADAVLYKAKRDSLKLTVIESQKSSLHKLLKQREVQRPYLLWIILASFVFIGMGSVIFLVVRKNNILAKQERASQKYLDEVKVEIKGDERSKLLKLLKENNPSFIFYFNEVFPDFSIRLLKVNPDLTDTEIEFCALLKIKLSTKEIARYIFIAPKTVLNKKYLIRNKLNIPRDTDIYYWIDNL